MILKKSEMLQFVFSLLLIVFLSFIQTASIFAYSIKPNLLLPALLVFSAIEQSWQKRLILIFLAGILIKSQTGFELEPILLLASAIFGAIMLDKLSSKQFLTLLGTVSVGTLMMNANQFILYSFALELAYNILITVILFVIVKKLDSSVT